MTQNTATSFQLIAIDDEEDSKLLYEYFFKKEIEKGQIQFNFLSSAASCLEALQANSLNTVILSDINMPDMNGLHLLEKIKQSYPDVKVIMVSAYSHIDYRDKCLTRGAEAYIEKPVDFDTLKQKILEVCSK